MVNLTIVVLSFSDGSVNIFKNVEMPDNYDAYDLDEYVFDELRFDVNDCYYLVKTEPVPVIVYDTKQEKYIGGYEI